MCTRMHAQREIQNREVTPYENLESKIHIENIECSNVQLTLGGLRGLKLLE